MTMLDNAQDRPGAEETQPSAAHPAQIRTRAVPISVNGVTISRKAIAAEVQNFPGRNPLESWQAAARALVIRKLLLQEARRLAIPLDRRQDEDGRKETEEDALVRALVAREVATPDADEESLRRFYEKNPKRFMTPRLDEVRHILLAARRDDPEAFRAAHAKASALAELLAHAPERFAAVASEWSACPSASVGGSLGQIGPGDTTPEFEAALVRLQPGETSGPVETRYGVHVIRLDRRIEGRLLPFEAVKERIAAYLDAHVRRRATAQYISLLIARADIKGISLDGAEPQVQ